MFTSGICASHCATLYSFSVPLQPDAPRARAACHCAEGRNRQRAVSGCELHTAPPSGFVTAAAFPRCPMSFLRSGAPPRYIDRLWDGLTRFSNWMLVKLFEGVFHVSFLACRVFRVALSFLPGTLVEWCFLRVCHCASSRLATNRSRTLRRARQRRSVRGLMIAAAGSDSARSGQTTTAEVRGILRMASEGMGTMAAADTTGVKIIVTTMARGEERTVEHSTLTMETRARVGRCIPSTEWGDRTAILTKAAKGGGTVKEGEDNHLEGSVPTRTEVGETMEEVEEEDKALPGEGATGGTTGMLVEMVPEAATREEVRTVSGTVRTRTTTVTLVKVHTVRVRATVKGISMMTRRGAVRLRVDTRTIPEKITSVSTARMTPSRSSTRHIEKRGEEEEEEDKEIRPGEEAVVGGVMGGGTAVTHNTDGGTLREDTASRKATVGEIVEEGAIHSTGVDLGEREETVGMETMRDIETVALTVEIVLMRRRAVERLPGGV